MSQETVLELARRALTLVVELCIPAVVISMVVGLVVSIVQAATQIQESTLAVVPRILAIFAALGVFGSWMLRTTVEFTVRMFTEMPGMVK